MIRNLCNYASLDSDKKPMEIMPFVLLGVANASVVCPQLRNNIFVLAFNCLICKDRVRIIYFGFSGRENLCRARLVSRAGENLQEDNE